MRHSRLLCAARERAFTMPGKLMLGMTAILVSVVAFAMWGSLVMHVIDYWDGASESRREDFVAYYAAASLVAQGLPEAIYQPEMVAEVEETILGRPAGNAAGLVFLNPPFVAGALQPLTGMPYGQAQAVWFAVTALAVAVSVALLWPELRRLPRPWGLVVALAALGSLPVFWSLLYAQLTPFVLLSWVGFYRLYVSKHEGPAGLILALSLVKAHLVIAPLLFLIVKGRWRALGGFAAGAALFVGGSVAFVGWETTFKAYPALLIDSMNWQREFGVDRLHMLSWSALLIRIFPDLGLTLKLSLSLLLSALTLATAAIVWRRRDGLGDGVAPLLALAVVAMLASPHVHLQDAQVFVLPAVVLAANRKDAIGIGAVGLLLFAIPASALGPNFAPLLLGALLAGLLVAVGVVPLPAGVRTWLRSLFGVAGTGDRPLSPAAIACRSGTGTPA